MQKQWNIKKAEPEIVQQLQDAIGINKKLCIILANRGITTFEEAKNFFRHNLAHLHNPFLMKDMDKAVNRLHQAIAAKERILVYGDYDVDGTTAVSLVYGCLREIYSEELLEYYIPDRYNEGYGISYAGIDYAKEHNFSLIIALDCGIKATEKIDYANKLGVDFIICDHHLPGEKIPKAVAVLDQKRNDCNYPYKELTGCGIGFKLMHAYFQTYQHDVNIVLTKLDLLCVSIASDIVPITGENRTLTHFGVVKLSTNPSIGMAALKDVSGITSGANIYKIVFGIGPRINAAGRIKHGKYAVELLTSKNSNEAMDMAMAINENNVERKKLDKTTTNEALEMISESEVLQNQKSTVLYQPHWHKGVIGIVASRVIETYYRPTIILTKSGDKVAGSARSVKGYDVYNAIESCSSALEQFGGHTYAAGLTMLEKNIPEFQKLFEAYVQSTITDEMLTPKETADCEVDFDEIDNAFWKILKQMAPFGPKNMRPQFITRNVVTNGYTKVVGDNHLQLSVKQVNGNSQFRCIAFKQGHLLPMVKSGKQFDIVYNVKENEWQGNVTLQLDIKDIHFE